MSVLHKPGRSIATATLLVVFVSGASGCEAEAYDVKKDLSCDAAMRD